MDTHAAETPEMVLERLDASIEDALHRLIDGGRVDDHHRESAESFRRRLADLQRRMRASRDITGRIEMPADARSDFDLLAWDFKRWLADVDRAFEDRGTDAHGFGRGAPG
jgi:hypothetical protein